MLFSSQIFILLFLPITLLAYYWLSKKLELRVWVLITASLIFYAYWDYRFVPFLFASVAVNWLLARMHNKYRARILIFLGVLFNLSAIGFFKYYNFLGSNIFESFQPTEIILPLGISFFTFQQISYLIDLKRGKAPQYKFSHYFLYVVFFPQLIAGPIVRHDELIPQLTKSPTRSGLYERLSRGGTLFVLGLAKKVLVADQVAFAVDKLFASTETLTFAESWIAALAYTVQIYFDFSAYSDMAIGIGIMFGFILPLNFNSPYRSASVREFWRRWHMTLSRFFRDYLYVPLGGNRNGLAIQLVAIMATMLLCGLWHGAGWTFVIWGGLHGLAIVINNIWIKTSIKLPEFISWAITSLFVVFCWVIFRAEDMQQANEIMFTMAGASGFEYEIQELKRLWLIPIALIISYFGPTAYQLAAEKLKPNKYMAVFISVLFVYIVLEAGKGQANEFIYFQF